MESIVVCFSQHPSPPRPPNPPSMLRSTSCLFFHPTHYVACQWSRSSTTELNFMRGGVLIKSQRSYFYDLHFQLLFYFFTVRVVFDTEQALHESLLNERTKILSWSDFPFSLPPSLLFPSGKYLLMMFVVVVQLLSIA